MTAALQDLESVPRIGADTIITQGGGLWSSITAGAATAWNFVSAVPRRALAWAYDTLHLGAVTSRVTSAARWVGAKALAFASVAGVTGMVGLGLCLVSTRGGRGLIWHATWPVRFTFNTVLDAWVWTAANVIDRLWAPGRWTAERMVDVDEFLRGVKTTGGQAGIFQRGIDWYSDHIAEWVHPATLPMGILQAVGWTMVTFKMKAILVFLLAGLTPWIAYPVIFAVLAFMVLGAAVGISAVVVHIKEFVQALATDDQDEMKAAVRLSYKRSLWLLDDERKAEYLAVENAPVVAAVPASSDGSAKVTVPVPPSNRAGRRGQPAKAAARNDRRVK